MINYKKGKNVEEELTKDKIPIENLPENFLWMHVKGSTKVSNVVDFAKKALDDGEYRSIVWTGCGGGIGKTISCAEILKRNYDLHQITRICYQKIEEYWDPITKGLEPIVASRQVPCIHILTSLDELDPKALGYQSSKKKTMFWNDPNRKKYPLPNYHDQLAAKYKNSKNRIGEGSGNNGAAGSSGGGGGGGNKQNFKKKNKERKGGQNKNNKDDQTNLQNKGANKNSNNKEEEKVEALDS